MSATQFEFLRNVTIGQYLPVDSLVHRSDPRARILAYLALLVALTITQRPEGLTLGALAVLAILVIAHIPLRYSLRGLLPPLPFLLLLAILQLFFHPVHAPSPILLATGPIVLTLADLLAAGMLLLRFSALILCLSLASYTLSPNDLTRGLEALLRPLTRLGIPVHDFVFVVQITLRYIPLLAQSAEQIAKAQAARGADWDSKGGNLLKRVRRVLPVLIPLFMLSFQRAENLALAMDARGYASLDYRTSLVELHFSLHDALAVLVVLLIAGAILWL